MNLLAAIAAHFIGDYAFQGAWFASEKGRSWEVNFYHAATYTAPFVLFANAHWWAAAILLLSHFLIDPLKARWKIIPPHMIWLDQVLHFTVIFLLVALHVN